MADLGDTLGNILDNPGKTVQNVLPGVFGQGDKSLGDQLGQGAQTLAQNTGLGMVGQGIGAFTGTDPISGQKLSTADRFMGLGAILGGVAGVGGALAYHKIKAAGGAATVAEEWRQWMAGKAADETGALNFPTWKTDVSGNPILTGPKFSDGQSMQLPPGQTVATQQAQTGGVPQFRTGPSLFKMGRPTGAADWLDAPSDAHVLGPDLLLKGTAKAGIREPLAEAFVRDVGAKGMAQVPLHIQGGQALMDSGYSQQQAEASVARWNLAQFEAKVSLFPPEVQDLWKRLRTAPESLTENQRQGLSDMVTNLSTDLQQNSDPLGRLPAGMRHTAIIPQDDGTFRHVVSMDTSNLYPDAATIIKSEPPAAESLTFPASPSEANPGGLPVASPGNQQKLMEQKALNDALKQMDYQSLSEHMNRNLGSLYDFGLQKLAAAHPNDLEDAKSRMANWYFHVNHWLSDPVDKISLNDPLPGYDGYNTWASDNVKDVRPQLLAWRQAHPDADPNVLSALTAVTSPGQKWNYNNITVALKLHDLYTENPNITEQGALDGLKAAKLGWDKQKGTTAAGATESSGPVAKALKVLRATDGIDDPGAREKAILNIIHPTDTTNQKTLNFYTNMAHPEDTKATTVDIHALDGAFGFNLTNSLGSFSQNLDDPRSYQAVADAYRGVAQGHGLTHGHQAQAMLWGMTQGIKDSGITTFNTDVRDLLSGAKHEWTLPQAMDRVYADPLVKVNKGSIAPSPIGAEPAQYAKAQIAKSDTLPGNPKVFNPGVEPNAFTLSPDNNGLRAAVMAGPEARKTYARWYRETSLKTTEGGGLTYLEPKVFPTVSDLDATTKDVFAQNVAADGVHAGGGASIYTDNPVSDYPGSAQDHVLHVAMPQAKADQLDELESRFKKAGIPVTRQDLNPHRGLSNPWENTATGEKVWDEHPPTDGNWVRSPDEEAMTSSAFHFQNIADGQRAWKLTHDWAPSTGEDIVDYRGYGAGPGEKWSPDTKWANEHVFAGKNGGYMTTLTDDHTTGNGVPTQVEPDFHGFFGGTTNKMLEGRNMGGVHNDGTDTWFGADTLIPEPSKDINMKPSLAKGINITKGEADLKISIGDPGQPNFVGIGPGAAGTLAMKGAAGTTVDVHPDLGKGRVQVFVPGGKGLVDRQVAERATELVQRLYPSSKIDVWPADRYKDPYAAPAAPAAPMPPPAVAA